MVGMSVEHFQIVPAEGAAAMNCLEIIVRTLTNIIEQLRSIWATTAAAQWAVQVCTGRCVMIRVPSLGIIALCIMSLGGATAPMAQAAACNANDPNLVTLPIQSPPVTFRSAFAQQGVTITINGATSDQSWTTATSIMPTVVVWTIDPAVLPPGLSCANIRIPLTEVVPTSCIAGSFVNFNLRGCPWGVYDPNTGYSGSCEYPAFGTPSSGTGSTTCTSRGINQGQINVNLTSSFYLSLVDPAPDLVSGNAVMNSTQLATLLTKGRTVKGVSADGVTEVVIRISTNSPGEQFRLTLLNDQHTQSTLPDEDGALGNPGATSFTQSQLTVTAGNIISNGLAYAFAVYRAPKDFARPLGNGFKPGSCQGVTNTGDDQLACRAVSLQLQDITANSAPVTMPITILRPMVSAIHGIWSNWKDAWKNFSPLVTANGVDYRFNVQRPNYRNPIVITASTPTYPNDRLRKAFGNSLGFQYNAPGVLGQINKYMGDFKNGKNPLGIPVAAVQADIVAHSLGGDITRTIASLPQFLNDPMNPTFGQGNIHKLVTIDTPHLGTPLATLLLNPNNACTALYLADHNDFSFSYVTLSGNTTSTCGSVTNSVCGAVGDLVPGSIALTNIANGPITHQLPTALIVGIYTNLTSLNSTVGKAGWVRTQCPNDPLTNSLTSDGWPGNFANNQNDAIVDVSSQLSGLAPSSGVQFTGYVHSQGTTDLGFTGPSVLDPDIVPPKTISIPNQVINLLNTPVTNQTVFILLNP